MNTKVMLAGLFLCMSGSALLAQDHYNDMMHSNIAKYRFAVQSRPNDAVAQEHLAEALYDINYRQVGNVVYTDVAPLATQDEAITHLKTAVALQPNHYSWQQTLGMYLSNRGRNQEAIPHLRQSLHMLGLVKPFNVRRGGPSNVMQIAQSAFSSHYLLGDALVKLGLYREAEAQYNQALLFDPDADWVLLGVGNALNSQGKRLQARAAWRKIMSHSPRPTFYTRQAHIRLAKYPA